MHSPSSQSIRWTTVDSSGKSPWVLLRLGPVRGLRRLVDFALKIMRRDVSGALIFSGPGMNFVERGLMSLMSRALGKRAVLCPRSGLLLEDISRSRFMRWYLAFVFRHCDVVVCQGQSWADRFKALTNLPDERFAIIPNWIDAREIEIQGKGLARDETVFLCLGRIESYKGVFDLVDAVGMRRNELSDARFVICGGGTGEAEMRRRVSMLGLDQSFDFRGWVHDSEKQAVLADSDVLVLPSHIEGMPNSVLEGMAAGLAILATRVGGVPDVVIDDSLGILVDPHDVAALGAGLVELHRSHEKRVSLGTTGKTHVLRYHDFEIIWPDLLRVLVPTEETTTVK